MSVIVLVVAVALGVTGLVLGVLQLILKANTVLMRALFIVFAIPGLGVLFQSPGKEGAVLTLIFGGLFYLIASAVQILMLVGSENDYTKRRTTWHS